MNRASDFGREIGRLAVLSETSPELEDLVFSKVEALKQPLVFAGIETDADALSALIVAISEVDVLACAHWTDKEAKSMENMIQSALYGVVGYLERRSSEKRSAFGGGYLTQDDRRDSRELLKVEAA